MVIYCGLLQVIHQGWIGLLSRYLVQKPHSVCCSRHQRHPGTTAHSLDSLQDTDTNIAIIADRKKSKTPECVSLTTSLPTQAPTHVFPEESPRASSILEISQFSVFHAHTHSYTHTGANTFPRPWPNGRARAHRLRRRLLLGGGADPRVHGAVAPQSAAGPPPAGGCDVRGAAAEEEARERGAGA